MDPGSAGSILDGVENPVPVQSSVPHESAASNKAQGHDGSLAQGTVNIPRCGTGYFLAKSMSLVTNLNDFCWKQHPYNGFRVTKIT